MLSEMKMPKIIPKGEQESKQNENENENRREETEEEIGLVSAKKKYSTK